MAATIQTMDALLPSIKENLQSAAAHAFKTLCHAQSQTLLHSSNYMHAAASNAAHTDQRQHLLQAIEKCRIHREEIDQAFAEDLLSRFSLLASQRPANITLSLMRAPLTSLHAEDDSSPRLLMDKIMATAQRQNEEVLLRIQAILQHNLPTLDVTSSSNPFAPSAIAHALYAGILVANIHSDAQVQLYTLYQREVFNKLGSFYQSLLNKLQQSHR